MTLKLITIDFWNTLFDSSNGTKRNQLRMEKLVSSIHSLGIKIESQEFEKAMQASWQYFNDIWKKDMRTPLPEETVGFFWNYFGLQSENNSIEEVALGFANSILDYPPKLLPGVKEALGKLSDNYKLAIVSDTGFSPGKVLKVLLENNEIIHFFDAFSFSDETSVSKPHPKAFSTILEQLECKPEEAIHIGDIERTDIVGAKKIGMKAIRFDGDSTAILNLNNPKESEADFLASSWEEILNIIGNIE